MPCTTGTSELPFLPQRFWWSLLLSKSHLTKSRPSTGLRATETQIPTSISWVKWSIFLSLCVYCEEKFGDFQICFKQFCTFVIGKDLWCIFRSLAQCEIKTWSVLLCCWHVKRQQFSFTTFLPEMCHGRFFPELGFANWSGMVWVSGSVSVPFHVFPLCYVCPVGNVVLSSNLLFSQKDQYSLCPHKRFCFCFAQIGTKNVCDNFGKQIKTSWLDKVQVYWFITLQKASSICGIHVEKKKIIVLVAHIKYCDAFFVHVHTMHQIPDEPRTLGLTCVLLFFPIKKHVMFHYNPHQIGIFRSGFSAL